MVLDASDGFLSVCPYLICHLSNTRTFLLSPSSLPFLRTYSFPYHPYQSFLYTRSPVPVPIVDPKPRESLGTVLVKAPPPVKTNGTPPYPAFLHPMSSFITTPVKGKYAEPSDEADGTAMPHRPTSMPSTPTSNSPSSSKESVKVYKPSPAEGEIRYSVW
jgi:hypothetical protein